MTFPLTIYAQFETEEDRKKFFDSHVAPFAGMSKPVFSHSIEDESMYRDISDDLLAALKEFHMHYGHSSPMLDKAWNMASDAIAKAENIK